MVCAREAFLHMELSMTSHKLASRGAEAVGIQIGLFLISFTTLALEIGQMRLFAFSLQFLLTHIVLSIALLGFGMSGTLFATQTLKAIRAYRRVILCSFIGFSVSVVGANVFFSVISPRVNLMLISFLPWVVSALFVLAVPYFFAGLAICAIFTKEAERINLCYCVNLIGSALGCVVIFSLLPPMGMERLLLLIAVVGCVAGGIYAITFSRISAAGCALLAVTGVLLLPHGAAIFRFQPDNNDQYAAIKRGLQAQGNFSEVHEFSVWDPAGKIDIYSFRGEVFHLPERVEAKWFCQDSGAGSILYDFGPGYEKGRRFFEHTVYGLPYLLLDKPKVLVIGLGGGVDVQTALYHNAREVTGVEINKAAIEAIEGPFAEFVGDPYGKPNVTVVHADGRTFAWKTKERYDLIQMTGADTKTFWTSNALALTINYLYTVEAFKDYLQHLTPGGILSIIRFDVDLERLSSIAEEAMHQLGIAHPERHVMIVFQGIWGNILIKTTPFTSEEIQRMRLYIDAHNADPTQWIHIPWYDYIGFSLEKPFAFTYFPGAAQQNWYTDFFRAAVEHREDEFLARQHNRLTPTTDDNPFFFMQAWWSHLLKPGTLYLKIYLGFILCVLFFSFIFIFLPLFVSKYQHIQLASWANFLVYFFAIGVGFMFTEIGLMQKLGIFLGHPSYAVSITLFALLFFSGLGSMTAQGLFAEKKARLIMFSIGGYVFYLALWLLGQGILLRAFIPSGIAVRALVVILSLAPLGFCMGMPFPSGLALARKRDLHLVPWAFGVNGFASVFGSLSFVLLVIGLGFTVSLLIGMAVYLVAFLSIALLRECKSS